MIMGVAERREREKEEMKKMIRKAAAEMFVKKGFDKTSMRNIADAIEYSPATIYLYYKDKNEIFYAISEDAFREFATYFSRVAEIADPMERLAALGKVYFEFAFDNPGYYDLMFLMKEPMETIYTEESWESGRKSHSVLTNVVKECIDRGHFKDKDPTVLSFLIWSFVHGVVSLKIRDRLKVYPDHDRDKLVYDALEMFNTVLREM